MSDEARAIIGTDYGATSRVGTIQVSTVMGGGVRLAVSHSDPNIDSYSSKFCTGVEMKPHKWREAIRLIEAQLPPECGYGNSELIPPCGVCDVCRAEQQKATADPDGTRDLDEPTVSQPYPEWANGGGPNECPHGIAAGLHCTPCGGISGRPVPKELAEQIGL